MNLKNILLTVVAIAIVTILPHLGLIPFPFGHCIPILLFVWLYLKYHEENFADLGFKWKSFSFKSVLIGCLSAILIFTFLQLIFFPILESFIEFENVDNKLYDQIRENTGFYIFILIMGWIVGGLYEEIVFHGFIFYRLEKVIPGKYATILGFLITSIIFGLYHFQLGSAGVINAFLAGATYHALVLYHKRNLWYGIFCHAAFDTIAITFLYLGYL